MAYADYLSHTWESRILDQKTFREWENGFITTEECYKRYLFNNNIKKASCSQNVNKGLLV